MAQDEANELTVEEILCNARKIIDERGWVKGYLATGPGGNSVRIRADHAQSFCAIGAVRRAAYELGITRPQDGRVHRALSRLATVVKKKRVDLAHCHYSKSAAIASFNDSQRSKLPVLDALCDAIKLERETRDG